MIHVQRAKVVEMPAEALRKTDRGCRAVQRGTGVIFTDYPIRSKKEGEGVLLGVKHRRDERGNIDQ